MRSRFWLSALGINRKDYSIEQNKTAHQQRRNIVVAASCYGAAVKIEGMNVFGYYITFKVEMSNYIIYLGSNLLGFS